MKLFKRKSDGILLMLDENHMTDSMKNEFDLPKRVEEPAIIKNNQSKRRSDEGKKS